MSGLKVFEFDGEDYYRKSDADEKIEDLNDEIEDLECSGSDLQSEIHSLECELSAAEDFEGERLRLIDIILASQKALSESETDGIEVMYNSRVMDAESFITEMQWQIKK